MLLPDVTLCIRRLFFKLHTKAIQAQKTNALQLRFENRDIFSFFRDLSTETV